jgi:CDGSH-type Zn-finger protein
METSDKKKIITTVEITDDGPIKVTGQILFKDLKRDKSDNPGEVYLCLCGRSGNKPYCDDSHKK